MSWSLFGAHFTGIELNENNIFPLFIRSGPQKWKKLNY